MIEICYELKTYCGIMACCKLGQMSAYHRICNIQEQSPKLPSYLWYVFPRQISHSEILPVELFMTEADPLFAQHSTSHTLDPFYLSLSFILLLSALIFMCSLLYKRLQFVHVPHHWIHVFERTLFSFEGLPYSMLSIWLLCWKYFTILSKVARLIA